MRFKGFIGQAYTLRSVNAECQRCVNMYPEVDEIGTLKDGEVDFLVGAPGKRLIPTLVGFTQTPSSIRCLYTATNGALYVVTGNALYSINSLFIPTFLGTLATSHGPVDMADNGLYLVIVDGDNLYYLSLPTS